MSVDIKPYLQYLEKEKNIPKDEACALIAEAIKSSVEKSVLAGQNIEVIADLNQGRRREEISGVRGNGRGEKRSGNKEADLRHRGNGE